MKRNKRGVSLIVLVITIIVMIILASAVIISLSNTGIINQAQQAVDASNNQEVQQLAALAWAEAFLNESEDIEGDVKQSFIDNGLNPNDYGFEFTDNGVTVVKGWLQTGTKVTKGDVTLNVADTVDYAKDGINGYKSGWQVLGAEDGQLLLISSARVGLLELEGKTGYETGVKLQDDMGATYLYKEQATFARALKMKDIDKVTGYDPDVVRYRSEIPYETAAYKNKVTYKMNAAGTYVMFTSRDGSWVTADGTDAKAENETNTYLRKLDGTLLAGDETLTVTSNFYRYNPSTLIDDTTGPVKGLATNSPAYNMFFAVDYGMWIADSYIYARFGRICYGIRLWNSTGKITGASLYETNVETVGHGDYAVRAVVYIKPELKLTPAGTNAWSLTK